MSQETERIRKVIQITNEISPTFCLAKWQHVTMYMNTGQTHSCYHPRPHEIPLEELKDNPSALHNTIEKKKERELMLKGEKPSGCQYCWNIESLSPDHISDRHIRNAGIYYPEVLEEVKNNSWDYNVNPSYIEISFSNECNFKCGYCHPKYSSSYFSEIRQHGPYQNVQNHGNHIDWFTIYPEENNPWIDAWWKWWPEMSKTLQILRITGGEPLMHRSTWKLLKILKESPMPQLELNFNSNLGVKNAMVDKFVGELKYLIDNKCIKRFKLYTSIDAWGERAEYIRTGLDLKIWEKNLDTYIKTIGLPVSFMITFNIFSVTTFKDLLAKILEFRKKYNRYKVVSTNKDQFRIIQFDVPYLKEPLQYDINLLPKDEFLPYMRDSLQFIKDNIQDDDPTKFSELEYERFRRVVDYMETTHYDEAKVREGRKDFYTWFTQYDQRRNVNLLETFPEMQNFFELCKNTK